MSMGDTEHLAVATLQPYRMGLNRYRLDCGHYVDCGCVHDIKSIVDCINCGKPQHVTDSAIVLNVAEKPVAA